MFDGNQAYFGTTAQMLAAYPAGAFVPHEVFTQGRNVVGDGGGARFFYNPNSAVAENYGTERVDTAGHHFQADLGIPTNICLFGAVNDDTGTATGLAVQRAVNALGLAGGGEVFVPVGDFFVTGDGTSTYPGRVFVTSSGVSFLGLGTGSALRQHGTLATGPYGGTGGFVTFVPANAVYPGTPGTRIAGNGVRNLALYGLDPAIYTVGQQGIEIENTLGTQITGCLISGFGAESVIAGAWSTGASGTFVNANEIEKGGNYWNPGNAEFTVFSNNNCHDGKFQGVEVSGLGALLDGNTFSNSVGGIALTSDATLERAGVTFTNNLVYNQPGLSVTTQTASQPTNVLVSGNKFIKCGDAGGGAAVVLTGGPLTTKSVKFQGNIISESTCATALVGIVGGQLVVTGNLIYPGVSGSQVNGIAGDGNAIMFVDGNTVVGHTTDISISATNGSFLGLNITSNGVYRTGQFITQASGLTGRVSIPDDTAVVLTNSGVWGAALAGMLAINFRKAVDGRNSLVGFAAHISGIPYTPASLGTSGNGVVVEFSTAVLSGTTGTDNRVTVSVNATGGTSWQVQVENRAGGTISLGWEVSPLSQ